jgi:hypothetical protein
MNRRFFLQKGAPAAALASSAFLAEPAAASPDAAPAYCQLITFRLHFVQMERFLGWLEKSAFPALNMAGLNPLGAFTMEIGPHVPSVLLLTQHANLAELDAGWQKLAADNEWSAGIAEMESAGPRYFRRDSILLRATPFSPPLAPTAAGVTNKVYELRHYEASTQRQLQMMHDRFTGGEIEVFAQCGIRPIYYGNTVVGPDMPNMIYLTPFESAAAREKAWAAFREHPGWKKLAAEWMEKSGELARNIGNWMLAPTGFSKLR